MIPFQITLVPSSLPRLNNWGSGYSQTSCHQNGGDSPHFHGPSAALTPEAGDKLLLCWRAQSRHSLQLPGNDISELVS